MDSTVSIEKNLSFYFEEKYERIKDNLNNRIISSYIGDLAEGLTYTLTNKLEESLLEKGIEKNIIRRVFSIVIEGLQNIRLHGEYDDEGQKLAAFILWQENGIYRMCFSNLIDQTDKDRMKELVKKINNLDKRSLKQHYISVMNNGIISKAGGAGLGLITIAMKSENPVELEFIDLAMDLSIITFSVKLH